MSIAQGSKFKKLCTSLITAALVGAMSSPAFAFAPFYTVIGNENIPGLTASQCVATDASKNLVSTGFACGSGSGTVTSVTGTANEITVVNPTTTPVISIPSNPVIPGLAASNCVGTNGSSALTSSGELCPTTYIAGVRAGGLHIETKQVTASATTPWEATVTFGAAYTAAPLCMATSFNATPNPIPVDIVSESTTTAVIFDGSQSGAVFNVVCVGF